MCPRTRHGHGDVVCCGRGRTSAGAHRRWVPAPGPWACARARSRARRPATTADGVRDRAPHVRLAGARSGGADGAARRVTGSGGGGGGRGGGSRVARTPSRCPPRTTRRRRGRWSAPATASRRRTCNARSPRSWGAVGHRVRVQLELDDGLEVCTSVHGRAGHGTVSSSVGMMCSSTRAWGRAWLRPGVVGCAEDVASALGAFVDQRGARRHLASVQSPVIGASVGSGGTPWSDDLVPRLVIRVAEPTPDPEGAPGRAG